MSLKLNRRSRDLCSPKCVSFLQMDDENSQRDEHQTNLEDSIARRKMAMRGFKSMSSISTKQNANNHYNAEDDTVQMLRLAVLDQYIARSSSAIETSSIKVPPKVSSIKSKKFSQSMPAKIVQRSLPREEGVDREQFMGSVMEGMDRVSSAITPEALEYVKWTCRQLDVDFMSLPCAQRLLHAEREMVWQNDLILERWVKIC